MPRTTTITMPRTTSGATYPSTLLPLAQPLHALLAQHPHLSSLAVGAFIFHPISGSLLLLRRSPTESAFPHLWEVPGGGVESAPTDATLLDAVVREVHEETGLQVTGIKSCYGYVEFDGRSGRRWRKWNFEVEVGAGEVVLCPEEHAELMWAGGEKEFEGLGLDVMAAQRGAIVEAFRVKAGEMEGGGKGGKL